MNARFRRSLTERGVAMVTVLLIGAVLTVVSSAASFIAIQEFRSGNEDRRAAEAHGYAEAGIDRALLLLKQGTVHWGQIREAGCALPPIIVSGPVGRGEYRAVITVYDPDEPVASRLPAVPDPIPDPWPTTNDSAAPCTTVDQSTRPNRPATHFFAITSRGSYPAASRVIRQVFEMGSLGLPVGIYAKDVLGQGTPNFNGVSMLVDGDVQGREQMGFSGNDPFNQVKEFWPQTADSSSPTADPNAQVPAGVHSTSTIYVSRVVGGSKVKLEPEHPPAKNCDANDGRGTADQSLWDQSGPERGGDINSTCPNWTGTPSGYPPTSLFTGDDLNRVAPKPTLTEEDFQILRDSARQTGVYCRFAANGTDTCYRAGELWTGFSRTSTLQTADVTMPPIKERSFVAYFDFEPGASGTLVKWKAAVDAGSDGVAPYCSSDPNVNRTVTVVLRRGSISLQGGTVINGAVIAPEGNVDQEGQSTLHGTVIADKFIVHGQGTFSMDECWVANMPGPFLEVGLNRWVEVDR